MAGWRQLPALLLLLLAGGGRCDHGATPSFGCTRAEYCDACPNATREAVAMAGSEASLMGNSTGERQLHASVVDMVAAVSRRWGPVANDVSEGLHLSFQYLCCYNNTELRRISKAMATVRWRPIPVRFSRVVCAASMALALADPSSQAALFGVVSAIEEAMAAAGLPVRGRFRAAQAPFHASLFSAHVGAHVDMSEVIALAQSTLPAGGGLNAEPILIDSFHFQGRTFHAQQLKADDEAEAPLPAGFTRHAHFTGIGAVLNTLIGKTTPVRLPSRLGAGPQPNVGPQALAPLQDPRCYTPLISTTAWHWTSLPLTSSAARRPSSAPYPPSSRSTVRGQW